LARLPLLSLTVALALAAHSAAAANLCSNGWWADVMIGSYHLHPYQHFDDFNPGAGVECAVTPQWAATFGLYRNSLDRTSWYGGAIYEPQFAHWSWVRLGLMGGLISGYNYGQYGIGSAKRIGPVLAPAVITDWRRLGANFILIPPIPADNLPFTIGLQLKYRFR
jgi:hypothetical protein